MRCSVLDLGSNSFHVLIADVDGSRLEPVARERELLHLGRVVARHGRVPAPDLARAEATVTELATLARRSGAEQQVAVATAALRDAANGHEVLARLSAAAGADVRVLSGEEEARIGYLGVRAGTTLRDEPVLVLDLGGGSLEVTVGTGTDVGWSTSLPLGVSRLSVLVDRDPVSPRELAALRAHVAEELAPHLPAVVGAAPRTAVAIGGTVRALARAAAVAGGGSAPDTVHELELATSELRRLRDVLLPLDLAGRTAVPGVSERRADQLHLAAVIVVEVLEQLGSERVTVSGWGLREGLLLELHQAAGATTRVGRS